MSVHTNRPIRYNTNQLRCKQTLIKLKANTFSLCRQVIFDIRFPSELICGLYAAILRQICLFICSFLCEHPRYLVSRFVRNNWNLHCSNNIIVVPNSHV